MRSMLRVLPLLLLCAAAHAAEVALPPATPAWLFSRDWDVVRLAVRGTDERDESLSVRLDTDAGVLILR